jgi:hypothetical protein
MSKKEGKTKNKIQAEFISPLEKYINEKCLKCHCWSINTCNTDTPNGIDRMFLCMSAANLQEPLLISDPKQILKDAKETLRALDTDGALKDLFPALFDQATKEAIEREALKEEL